MSCRCSKEQAARKCQLVVLCKHKACHLRLFICRKLKHKTLSVQSLCVAFYSERLHSTRRCRQSKENVMVPWEHENGSGRRRVAVSTRGPLDNVNNQNTKTFGAENDLPFAHLNQCVERLSNNRVMRLRHANYEVLEGNDVFIALLFLTQLTPTTISHHLTL